MPAASPAWPACAAAIGLPLTVHPLVWTRRRLALPGRPEWELPTLSAGRSLEGEGFEVIERRQPSVLLDGSVLITGEVDRTTDFETGMQFPRGVATTVGWEPDPLILDDQALVVHVRGLGPRRADRVRPRRGGQHRRATRCGSPASTGCPGCFGGFHLTGPAFEPIIEPTVEPRSPT